MRNLDALSFVSMIVSVAIGGLVLSELGWEPSPRVGVVARFKCRVLRREAGV